MREIKGIRLHEDASVELYEKIMSSDKDGIDPEGIIHCFTAEKYNESIKAMLNQIDEEIANEA